MEPQTGLKEHVIEYIDEELETRGWSRWHLGEQMGGDVPRNVLALELLELKEPDMLLGDEIAEKLGNAFGTGPEIWANLDAGWRAEQKLIAEHVRLKDAVVEGAKAAWRLFQEHADSSGVQDVGADVDALIQFEQEHK